MKKYDKTIKSTPPRFHEDEAIQIERSEAFMRKADELSDYIAALPLTKEQNDRLVALTVEQVCLTEMGALKEGVRAARDLAKKKGGVPYVQ